MYYDHTTFPDDKALIGQYLRPAIDVGSMLVAKTLKPNRQYVCRSALRHLDDDERNSEVHKTLQHDFDQEINRILGTAAKLTDFDKQDLTPENMHYEGDATALTRTMATLNNTRNGGQLYRRQNYDTAWWSPLKGTSCLT